jgi:hypothetical protein
MANASTTVQVDYLIDELNNDASAHKVHERSQLHSGTGRFSWFVYRHVYWLGGSDLPRASPVHACSEGRTDDADADIITPGQIIILNLGR